MNELLDLKFLNILINSKKDLHNFCASAGRGFLSPEYRSFVDSLAGYYNMFDCCPTLNTLKEYCVHGNKQLEEQINAVWCKAETAETDPREYGFILNKIAKRYNIEILKHIANRAREANEENLDVINDSILKVVNEIRALGEKKIYRQIILKDYVEEWKQAFFAKIKNPELAQGLMTGFPIMDYYTNGLKKKTMGLICGSTSTGKSIFLLQLAKQFFMGKNILPNTVEELIDLIENNKWQRGYNVLFISLEMNYDAVADRILSAMASVNSLDIDKADITPEEAARIKLALGYWQNSPNNIKIADMPRGCSVADIARVYDETCLEFVPDVVIIDYMGLMLDSDAKTDQDWEKLKNISEEIHEFSRANNVLTFTAMQLQEVKQSNENLGLHNIGRSRMVAHNCDLVLIIQNRENEDMRPDSLITCAKLRKGPKFIMNNLRKEFQYTRFGQTEVVLEKDKRLESIITNKPEDLSQIIEQIFGEERAEI